ncbi:MAG: hypothetical protein AOA65_0394 [Candidatus Bathyarchaeota archaeon BA1]|nr:MAG: hypothetical protein AOA65_0394 [Candidatus Bathyarchaeota archaeon BA1]
MKRNTKIGLVLAAISFIAFMWPVIDIMNRIDIFIFGMPLLFFWETIWIGITVIFMAIMYKVLKI